MNEPTDVVATDHAWAMRLLSRLGDVAFVLDLDGRVVWRRELRPGATGTPDGLVEGVGMLERVHPDDVGDALIAFDDLVAGVRERVELDARLRYADRDDEWMFNRIVGVRLPGGRVAALARVLDGGIQVDLTTPAAPGFSMAEAAPIGLALVGLGDVIVYRNTAFAEATGLSTGHLLDSEPLQIDLRATVARARRSANAALDVSANGRDLLVSAHRLGGADRPEVLLTTQDVTELTTLRAAQRTADELFTTAFDHAPAGMALVGLDRRILRANPAFAAVVGHDIGALARRPIDELWHPGDSAEADRMAQRILAGEVKSCRTEMRYLHRDGHPVWVEVRASGVHNGDGVLTHTVAHVLDISTRKIIEEQQQANEAALLHRATHDPLTDLPNRALLDEHLRLLVARVRREAEEGAVLYCDLDGFKAINDTHGHRVGDRMLVALAGRLRSIVRATDLVARVGGDEFVVALAATDHPEGVAAVAERLHDIVIAPVKDADVGPISCGVSIGVARVGPDDDPSTVVHRADALAYEAKRSGGGIRQQA